MSDAEDFARAKTGFIDEKGAANFSEALHRRTPSMSPFLDLLKGEAERHPERYALPEGYVPPPPSCDASWEIGEPCDGGVEVGCTRKPGHKGPHLGYHDNSYGEGRIVWTTPCHHEEE